MAKPVQWLTPEELHQELDRTRPAWEAHMAEVDDVLATGRLLPESEGAARHRAVVEELFRRSRE